MTPTQVPPKKPRIANALHTGLSAAMIVSILAVIVCLPIAALLALLQLKGWPGFVFLVVPITSLAAGLLAAFGALRINRDAIRRHSNQCIKCGYDLRASTGRCPECGREI